MPQNEYVINLNNNKLDFYKENMTFEDFVKEFGNWYGKGKRLLVY